MNESRRRMPMKQVQGGAETKTSHEPGSNKRPSSSVVVARLMGLESLTDFSSEVETSKIMPPLNDHPSSRLSRNGEEYKQNHGSVSLRVYLKIKPASQQQEDNESRQKKPLFMVGWRKDRVKDQSPRLRRVLYFTFKLTSVPDWREALLVDFITTADPLERSGTRGAGVSSSAADPSREPCSEEGRQEDRVAKRRLL
ncbi:hypothetical protein Tco_1024249 [Tanacetum coccineum]